MYCKDLQYLQIRAHWGLTPGQNPKGRRSTSEQNQTSIEQLHERLSSFNIMMGKRYSLMWKKYLESCGEKVSAKAPIAHPITALPS